MSTLLPAIFWLWIFHGGMLTASGRSDWSSAFSRKELARIAGYGEELISKASVTGTVVRVTGSPPRVDFSDQKGAKLALQCREEGKLATGTPAITTIHIVTDEFGEFTANLPSHLHALPSIEDSCEVQVLHDPSRNSCTACEHDNARHDSCGVKLTGVGSGSRVYSAGIIRLQDRCLKSKVDKDKGSRDSN